MSDFIRHLNLIKTRRTQAWLTPSQQIALARLQKVLPVPGTVNLFGGIGSGKTFLAWFLAEQLTGMYLTHPDALKEIEEVDTAVLILDNCQAERQAHRELLKELQFRQVRHAVLITRQLIHDYTHYVELALTSTDLQYAHKNLSTLGLGSTSADPSNLWHLVNSCI